MHRTRDDAILLYDNRLIAVHYVSTTHNVTVTLPRPLDSESYARGDGDLAPALPQLLHDSPQLTTL